MKQTHELNTLQDNIINAVLKTLRDQRDDKQSRELYGSYVINPQSFQNGNHYVTPVIDFGSPFSRKPFIVFGLVAEQASDRITPTNQGTSGYVPLIISPYVYGYDQSAGAISGFYMGLYLLTSLPNVTQHYTINWYAKGKASAYAQHRIDEAWTSAYNNNEADHLLNETGQTDDQ